MVDISELLGKYIFKIERTEKDGDCLVFNLSNGAIYEQYHEQDCCENVWIEDINGDLDDLIGSFVTSRRIVQDDPNASESGTWTFYKFATRKGYVTIRWYGSSNGYYSESAGMYKIKAEDSIKEQRTKKINKINKNG